ncbi:MAG: DUF2461 domain-containing protein [Tannerella sp.]|jgi:uncharacterized protein (TIGR02453 family)|nr:DUF2461 domain-containing protein [Tannerella sp.]
MKEIFKFLKELRENNDREWFKANKSRYDELHGKHVAIVQKIIDGIATFDGEIAGLDAKNCIYRIYRDIRFSYDKTPYKTHFGAYMTGFGGRTSPYGGYYLHLEPDNSLVSGGVWCPSPEMLKRLRRDIYDSITEFVEILEEKKFKEVYGGLEGEMLKRLPEGFPKDFKYEDILRHKYFVVSAGKPEKFFCSDDWIERAVEDFRILCPFNKFLNYTIGEFLGKQ